MNSLLKLNKNFKSQKAKRSGLVSLPAGGCVTSDDAIKLSDELSLCVSQWTGANILEKILIDVRYKKVVAKSNRISVLLAEEKNLPEKSIRGAKFSDTPNYAHVITHYVSATAIEHTAATLQEVAHVISNNFQGTIDAEKLANIQSTDAKKWSKVTNISKSRFSNIVHDICFVDKFELTNNANDLDANTGDEVIVTLYKTEESDNPTKVLNALGVNVQKSNCLRNSVLLNTSDYAVLLKKAPFLVAMQTCDITKIPEIPAETLANNASFGKLPAPTIEPCIGVIDTPFDTKYPPYFSEWVEYHHCLDKDVSMQTQDYIHGTAVCSIIVDGANLNPELDDGCGRFRVRHFGVATASGFSSFDVIKKLEQIISNNRDIKVWNLSLGSMQEIDLNSVSPEAAIIDELQVKYGVIFVIAGTNRPKGSSVKRIGAPADSLNSLVVSSVRTNGEPASYTRCGPVLGFYIKPDVSYYGGDNGDVQIRTCIGTGERLVQGTSFAAPFVARKLAFLVEKLGFSVEAAKALIIDSTQNWECGTQTAEMCHGVVPIDIKDIVESKKDEIKFLISGTASDYLTYCYEIPVPKINEKYPFVVRTTLCYRPTCDRNQGIDYTCTELDLHFGRLNGTVLKAINANVQNQADSFITERSARASLRKWDNVKIVSEKIKPRTRKKKAYSNDFWGFKIYKTSRYQDASRKESQHFSLIVTLKELDGQNRYQHFVQRCAALGWSVNEIKIDNQLDVFEESQEEIDWE